MEKHQNRYCNQWSSEHGCGGHNSVSVREVARVIDDVGEELMLSKYDEVTTRIRVGEVDLGHKRTNDRVPFFVPSGLESTSMSSELECRTSAVANPPLLLISTTLFTPP